MATFSQGEQTQQREVRAALLDTIKAKVEMAKNNSSRTYGEELEHLARAYSLITSSPASDPGRSGGAGF